MNAKKFSDAMSELDNKYIDEALNYKKKVKKPIWFTSCLYYVCSSISGSRFWTSL